MIFVMVGLHDQGFDRLVRVAGEMASRIDELVVIQGGATWHTPQSAHCFDFADETEMQSWLSQARVVVSHGGAGSILDALQAGKPLVVVPRLERFDEHIDDHQLELAKALAQQGKALAVTDLSVETLQRAIVEATQLTDEASVSRSLQTSLRIWLDEQSTQPAPRLRRLFHR